MTDLARTIIAAQTHRRMVDPISWAKRVRPFVVYRPAAADPIPRIASHPGPASANTRADGVGGKAWLR